MRRAAALLLIALAACSKQEELNYRHCLKLRVGMSKADMVKIMGEPETTLPYVEGKSLEYLKGRTAYEWSNPASMPGGDHVSLEDAAEKIESIRCSNSEITASVFVEPPAPSSSTAASKPTAPAAAPVALSSVPAPGLPEAIAAYKKKDFQTAMKLAGPLAQNGDAEAQLLAGEIFLNGAAPGREKDGQQVALMWFYKSGRQKNAEAQALYANIISTNGSPDQTAFDEIKLAADAGSPAGQMLAADVFLKGTYPEISPVNNDEGEKWLALAAQGGDGAAQLTLARRYQTMRKDYVEAYHWALVASRHPLTDKFADPMHSLSTSWTPELAADAKKLLRELKSLMKPDQVKDAEARAAQK